jgi:hypothetical protein
MRVVSACASRAWIRRVGKEALLAALSPTANTLAMPVPAKLRLNDPVD